MTGIVRTRSHFVGRNRTVGEDEEFNAQNSLVLKRFGNTGGVVAHLLAHLVGYSGRENGCGENAVAVHVFKQGERDGLTGERTHDDHRDFFCKRKLLFEDAHPVAEFGKGGLGFGDVADASLAFAVVAHAGGLQNCREKRCVQGVRVVGRQQRGVGCHGNARNALQEGLFIDAILGDCHGVGGRSCDAGAVGCQGAQHFGGHVFKLGGDSRRRLTQLFDGLLIGVGGVNVIGTHLRSGAFALFEHFDFVAHACGGLRKHAAELAAAEKTENGAGGKREIGLHTNDGSGKCLIRERAKSCCGLFRSVPYGRPAAWRKAPHR